MLIVPRRQGPGGIALPLTDVQHLSGIKHKQQVDFLGSEQLEKHENNIQAFPCAPSPCVCLCTWESAVHMRASHVKCSQCVCVSYTYNVT